MKYGYSIFDGERINANGIKLALDLEDIPKEERPIMVQKINAYFGSILQTRAQQREDHMKGIR